MHNRVVLGQVLLLVGQVGVVVGWHHGRSCACDGVALQWVLSLVALWQVSIVASLACHGRSALWQVLCAMMGWHCGSCAHWGGVVAGLAHVGVVSQQVGIMVGLAWHVGMALGWHHGRLCAL